MAFTFGVAVGLARYSSERLWPEALLSSVSGWMILGLMRQSFNLWKEYHQQDGLSYEERWGWRFAILWRFPVTLLLVVGFLFNQLLLQSVVELPVATGDFLGPLYENEALHCIYLLCLLFMLFSAQPRETSRKSPSGSRAIVTTVGYLLVLGIGLITVLSVELLPFLVHLSCFGLTIGQSSAVDLHPVGNELLHNWSLFSRWTILACCIVVGNFLSVIALGRQWTKGPLRRFLLGGALLIGLSFAITYGAWAYEIGLPSVTPFVATSIATNLPHHWFILILLLAIITSTVAYRLSTKRCREGFSKPRQLQLLQSVYSHERPIVLVLLVVGLLGLRMRHLVESLLDDYGSFWTDLYYSLDDAMTDAVGWLEWIGILLALRILHRRWFRKLGPPQEPPTLISPGQFLAVWLSLFLSLATALVPWSALGFAMWVNDFWTL